MLAIKDGGIEIELGFDDHLLFFHVEHEAVAVVVVADVLLIEPGHGADFVLGADVLAIPVNDAVLAVGVERGPENQDDLIEDGINLRVALRGDQLVGQRHGVLRARDLVGVQAAIDVDDDGRGAGKLAGLGVVEIGGVGEAVGDLFDLVETGEIFGAGNDGDLDVLAFGGLADGEHLHAIGGCG